MSTFIIARTFNNNIEAHIVQGRLLSQGIPCFLKDEQIVSMNPLYGIAVGGIKLMIREEDKMTTENILNTNTEDTMEN